MHRRCSVVKLPCVKLLWVKHGANCFLELSRLSKSTAKMPHNNMACHRPPTLVSVLTPVPGSRDRPPNGERNSSFLNDLLVNNDPAGVGVGGSRCLFGVALGPPLKHTLKRLLGPCADTHGLRSLQLQPCTRTTAKRKDECKADAGMYHAARKKHAAPHKKVIVAVAGHHLTEVEKCVALILQRGWVVALHMTTSATAPFAARR